MQAEAGASLSSQPEHEPTDDPRRPPTGPGRSEPTDGPGGPTRSARLALTVLGVGLAVYALDRVTKMWALASLAPGEPREFVGSVLQFRLIFNPGAAFSLGTEVTPVFTVIQAVVSIGVLYAALRVRSLPWAVALGLVLGGATGNLTDRLTRPPGIGLGHVVDFLELPNFPVFNIADSAIVAAAVLVALLSLRNVPFAHEPATDRSEPRASGVSEGSPGG